MRLDVTSEPRQTLYSAHHRFNCPSVCIALAHYLYARILVAVGHLVD
jgi:hypothetical protein